MKGVGQVGPIYRTGQYNVVTLNFIAFIKSVYNCYEMNIIVKHFQPLDALKIFIFCHIVEINIDPYPLSHNSPNVTISR